MTLSRVGAVLLLMSASVTTLRAQGLCLPSTDSHEAHTFGILSVPVAFTGAQAPVMSHGFTIGIEAATLPTVDSADATPTECRPDKGPENTHPIAGIVRPRVAFSTHMITFEVSWIPPVTVNEVQANLVGLAISHAHPLGGGWMLGLRADAVLGTLHAPVTCDDAALLDPASECYRGTRSNDRWQPGVYGFEASVGGGRGRLRPYVGVGYTLLRPRFQVDFTNAAGSTDHTEIDVNLQRVAVFGGVTWLVGSSSLTADAYSTPEDAVTARIVFRTALSR